MPSCAAWLSWKCQIAPGTAREHVRVARLLGVFPLICEEFGAGRLSYAKVRALTRISTPETEQDPVEMARPMTASQLERFAQAHRRVSRGEQEEVRRRRKLTWRYDADKAIGITIWLPPEQGAVVLQAIRAWTSDVEHPHHPDQDDGPSRTRAEKLEDLDTEHGIDWAGENPPWQRDKTPAEDMADAIVIHAGTGAVTDGGDVGVSAETPLTNLELAFPVTHPAYPMRCHVEDGLALSPATLQMIACNAAISTMLHDVDGSVLNVGRRSRRPSAALRRAARERDRYRCRFPGCESRRVDLHHILFWTNGGETKIDNIVCLCRRHHTIVHDKGITIATADGGFAFYLPDGTLIPASPPLPGSSADGITTCHGAAITPSTIIPPHSGERLDLHLAIWICFANAKNQRQRH